jgi:hypothetical protein
MALEVGVSTGSGPPYDVFVSYAHADNEKPLGSTAQYGWVTTLAHNLNTGPNHFRKNLFIDHRLKAGDVFSDDLLTTVGQSTLLLLLLSQNYIDSKWCGQELDHFNRTHANDPNQPADIFVVELFPFEAFAKVPPNIQNLRKRLIHAQFWHRPVDVSAPLLAGNPTPQESGPESERHYWRKLHELRNAIDSRLRTLKGVQPSVSVPVQTSVVRPVARQKGMRSMLGTILLADTTDDVVPLRSAVRAALEPEGVVVLPEGDYVSLTLEEFEKQFAQDLEKSQLFVQLLSLTVGRTGRTFTAPLPQLQFERAAAAKLPIMQWCERLPAPREITDPGHAKLFNTEFLRATNRTAFESEILGKLRMIRQEEVASAVAPTQPIPGSVRKLIFIDDVAGQKDLNDKLRAWLRSANCDIRGLPPKAILGDKGIDLVQVLKLCRAGITVFADSAKLETVYNRLIFFLNQIAESRLPVNRWGVYVTSETVGFDLGLTSDDVLTITEEQLSDFVNGLE